MVKDVFRRKKDEKYFGDAYMTHALVCWPGTSSLVQRGLIPSIALASLQSPYRVPLQPRHLLNMSQYSSPSLKDRTAEFQQLVASHSSGSNYISPRERLLQGGAGMGSSGPATRVGTPVQVGSNGSVPGTTPKGEFARKAQAIGKDITDTTAKLSRLAQRE